MKKLIIVTAIALAAVGAQAQTYGEIGYTSVTAKDSSNGSSIEASPSAIRGILGYELNPHLAIEGMVGFGMSDDTIKVNGANLSSAKLAIDSVFGVYLKPKTKLNEKVEVFARVGFAEVKGTTTVTGFGSETSKESSLSFGAGMSYAINPTTSFNADYMQYLSKDGFKANGFTFGVGFKF